MAVMKMNRRRLGQLMLAAGLLLSGVMLWNAQDAAKSLDDQLESARWRDDAAPARVAAAEEDDNRLPSPLLHTAAPAHCAEWIQVGIIFTKADQHPKMKPNLLRLLKTLSARTKACVNFNMFTDERSQSVIDAVFAKAQLPNRFKVTSYAIAPMADQMKSLIEVLQVHFAPRKGTYYNDVLFFLTTTMHRSLPGLDRLIMLDIDISVRDDLALLVRHFDRFSAGHVMGLSWELSPVYRHVLAAHRQRTGNLSAGGPPPDGFPGLNSGVVLLDLARMRSSERYNALLTPEEIAGRVARYDGFKGHLGDQDLYTLLALDDPELFYVLPCGWNRQLCTFWRKVQPDVFEEYFRCEGHISIYHGNCQTELPKEEELQMLVARG